MHFKLPACNSRIAFFFSSFSGSTPFMGSRGSGGGAPPIICIILAATSGGGGRIISSGGSMRSISGGGGPAMRIISGGSIRSISVPGILMGIRIIISGGGILIGIRCNISGGGILAPMALKDQKLEALPSGGRLSYLSISGGGGIIFIIGCCICASIGTSLGVLEPEEDDPFSQSSELANISNWGRTK